MKCLGLLLSCFWGSILAGPFKLPSIPDIMKPPVPYESELDDEALRALAEQDPEVTPGLFQGDMALNNEVYDYWRVGLRWDIFPERMWENGTVPYVISPLYEPAEYITIRRAIATISFMTCVKFVPWNGKAKDFLLIWPIKYPKGHGEVPLWGNWTKNTTTLEEKRNDFGGRLWRECDHFGGTCWSFVGRYGGPQIVSLEPPDEKGPNCLGNEGRAIHELLHALGIFHEQSREDRDKFVKIHSENIIPQFLSNFDKQSLENTTYKFEYDYDSIMHYGKNFFSKGKGKPSITPKYPGAKLGQRKTLSKTDCLKVNDLYGCLEKSVYQQQKYYTICRTLGL